MSAESDPEITATTPAVPGDTPDGWNAQPRYGVEAVTRDGHDRGGTRGRRGIAIALVILGGIVGALVTAAVVQIRQPRTAEIAVAPGVVEGVGTSSTVTVAKRLAPSVATVVNHASTGGQDSLGSGFVFANDSHVGYLITNNHVVAGASELDVVMPDGHAYRATLVGTDVLDDIAVVSVPDPTLPAATFGVSASLVVGQQVVAIGSPLGDQGSVTAGIISATHRTISAGDGGQATETLQDVLQTDASINPGNSGGPLADTDGNVVGVNVAIAGNGTNIGFSIPADLARRVAESLISHQRVEHPFLGIVYLTAIQAVEQGKGFDGAGVLVDSVSNGTPAAAAGLHSGDIIVAVDNVNIDNGMTLGGLIQNKRDNQKVTLSVKRGSRMLSLDVTLVERPASLPSH